MSNSQTISETPIITKENILSIIKHLPEQQGNSLTQLNGIVTYKLSVCRSLFHLTDIT